MQHFFVMPDQVGDNIIYIEGSDVNHMRNVLRMRPGEELSVSDGNNGQYVCRVEDYEEERAVLKIMEKRQADTELPSRIYLFQGLPKQEKMEFIIQKCVELGVYAVVPTVMKRCVVRLDEKKADKKVERWNKISESASKQAGRSRIPEVLPVMSFEEALDMASELDICLLPYELASGMKETKEVIEAVKPGQSIGIFIGPEGGFAKEEAELAISSGAKEITLGKRILRTETAGLAIVSVLMFHLEG